MSYDPVRGARGQITLKRKAKGQQPRLAFSSGP
jgi:hypothetical protein